MRTNIQVQFMMMNEEYDDDDLLSLSLSLSLSLLRQIFLKKKHFQNLKAVGKNCPSETGKGVAVAGFRLLFLSFPFLVSR